jgi:hypothetical protein
MNVRLFRGWIVAFIALLGATPLVSLAQVWSTGSNGQMGYHGTPNPVSPNCTAPLLWTLTNGHYSCQAPPPPSCLGGYTETAAPSWNGAAWVGMVCVPTTPPPPTVTCASEAQSQGYTLTNGYGMSGPITGYYTKFDGSYGYGTYNQVKYGANGPVWNDVCANTGTAYILYCSVSPTDGSVLGQLTGSPDGAQSASQCSGVN